MCRSAILSLYGGLLAFAGVGDELSGSRIRGVTPALRIKKGQRHVQKLHVQKLIVLFCDIGSVAADLFRQRKGVQCLISE